MEYLRVILSQLKGFKSIVWLSDYDCAVVTFSDEDGCYQQLVPATDIMYFSPRPIIDQYGLTLERMKKKMEKYTGLFHFRDGEVLYRPCSCCSGKGYTTSSDPIQFISALPGLPAPVRTSHSVCPICNGRGLSMCWTPPTASTISTRRRSGNVVFEV